MKRKGRRSLRFKMTKMTRRKREGEMTRSGGRGNHTKKMTRRRGETTNRRKDDTTTTTKGGNDATPRHAKDTYPTEQRNGYAMPMSRAGRWLCSSFFPFF